MWNSLEAPDERPRLGHRWLPSKVPKFAKVSLRQGISAGYFVYTAIDIATY